jgi:hypothetical protein
MLLAMRGTDECVFFDKKNILISEGTKYSQTLQHRNTQ